MLLCQFSQKASPQAVVGDSTGLVTLRLNSEEIKAGVLLNSKTTLLSTALNMLNTISWEALGAVGDVVEIRNAAVKMTKARMLCDPRCMWRHCFFICLHFCNLLFDGLWLNCSSIAPSPRLLKGEPLMFSACMSSTSGTTKASQEGLPARWKKTSIRIFPV